MLVLMRDLRHSANLLWACVSCKKLSSCLFKTHPPNDCNLFSWSTFFCNLSVFSVCVQDHSHFWCGVSCNVPPLFDFLLNSQEVFWSCLGNPSFAFPCLPAHRIRQSLLAVFRTHLQLCRHLLRSVFLRFKQPMVSRPSSDGKTRKCSCEAKNRTAARGRCLGLKPLSLRPR